MAQITSSTLAQLYDVPELRNYLNLIETKLREVARNQPLEVSPLMSYSVEAGGKRLRPLLALLSCKAMCGNPLPALPIAVAYELAHTAALVQDDIMDACPKRRGKTSLWRLVGTGQALLISDLMIFEIFRAITEYENTHHESRWLYRMLKLVYRSAHAAAVGQMRDMQMTFEKDITPTDYLETVRLKSGTLIAASCAAGALAGGASDDDVDLFYTFGEKLGMAFQIQDDILDVMGDENSLGKPVLTDFRNRKRNLLIIYGLSDAPPEDRAKLRNLMSRKSLPRLDTEQIGRLLEKVGALARAQYVNATLAEEARQLLTNARNAEARRLLTIVSYALENRFA